MMLGYVKKGQQVCIHMLMRNVYPAIYAASYLNSSRIFQSGGQKFDLHLFEFTETCLSFLEHFYLFSKKIWAYSLHSDFFSSVYP